MEKSFFVKLLKWYGLYCRHRGQWWLHAMLRKIFNVKVHKPQEVVRAGLKWVLNPSDIVQEDLFWLGTKETWEIYHSKKLLKPNSVIFDIGANFGYYSLMLAHYLKGDCSIYAFEPYYLSFESLQTNVKMNELGKSIQTFQMGFSHCEETGSLTVSPDNTGGAYFSPTKGAVLLSTIDLFCEKHHIEKIDFIKIDVEGYEPFVLKGAKKILSKTFPVIVIELNPSCLKRQKFSPQSLVDIVLNYGYSLFIPNRKKLEPFIDLPALGDHVNVFCFHKNSLCRIGKHKELFYQIG